MHAGADGGVDAPAFPQQFKPHATGRIEARISYEDHAVAIVAEIENQRHLNPRFTVGC